MNGDLELLRVQSRRLRPSSTPDWTALKDRRSKPTNGSIAVCPGDHVKRGLWSAKIALRTGGREEVFVMQPAKNRIGTDGVRFSATMSRSRLRNDLHGGRWIGNTRTKRHVRTPGIVMAYPRI